MRVARKRCKAGGLWIALLRCMAGDFLAPHWCMANRTILHRFLCKTTALGHALAPCKILEPPWVHHCKTLCKTPYRHAHSCKTDVVPTATSRRQPLTYRTTDATTDRARELGGASCVR